MSLRALLAAALLVACSSPSLTGDLGHCDADGDGFPGPQCDGDDHCDSDAAASPDTLDFFESPNACGDYDYDSDGEERPLYPDSFTEPLNDDCDGFAHGWEAAPPGCGNSAAFVWACQPGGPLPGTPSELLVEDRTQACN